MSDIRKVSIALTGEQVDALKAAVSTGEYATTSEIVREAIRDWQLKHQLRREELLRLRQLWDEGEASGDPQPLDLADLKEQARRRLRQTENVPGNGP